MIHLKWRLDWMPAFWIFYIGIFCSMLGLISCLSLLSSSEFILLLLLAVNKHKWAFSDGCHTCPHVSSFHVSLLCHSDPSLSWPSLSKELLKKYFQQANVTLNDSSSVSTFMNVSLLQSKGDFSSLIKGYLSATSSVIFFMQAFCMLFTFSSC